MSEPAVVHSTFVIERTYPVPPARVFAAFADPAEKRRWYAEGGTHTLDAYALDFRVGGEERWLSRLGPDTPFPGVELASDSIFLDVVPGRRIVMAQTMSIGGRRMSAALITFEIAGRGDGTGLVCTHQGAFFENSDGPERREEGWRKLLDSLDAALAAHA
jgi:uncharacterized protein YndB with AHSA1/START domain